MSIRIARLHGQRDLRVETLPDPEPAPGEVVVAIGAGGICGSDIHYYTHGGIGEMIRVQEPIIIGHEAAGTITALGEGVEGLSVGQRVALNPSHPCGRCSFCEKGAHQHCLNMRFKGSAMFMPHEQGFFRDRIAIGAAQCYPIAEGVPMAEAALSEPLAVCRRAITRALEVAGTLEGKRVLVTGAGPIGALCVALAKHFGASEIVVTDLQDATLAVAKDVGATRTVNVATHGADLTEYEAEKGYFDIAFECSAAQPALRSAILCTRPMGTIVQVGVMGDTPVPFNLLVSKEINLIGTHRFDKEFGQAVELINTQAMVLAPIVTHSLPIADAVIAMELATDRGKAVKVQITFD
ncbi:L-idonate 5-dehydrogenase [Pseudooceanicola spongiae]|uniref:Alcohol dehydrogenase catalytic domain-containing protein n=1 Tax=Pseudooceanicola spongiae TaxID=2613965 RepID=A0A7L9WR92_9RHOB|nr:L-idonate 5-dehydrogenase [Pseudooceanicola spongiae]QOL82364.1 alcohol dehydrogenase catalytic domain-containing protein [Pseudooceanicola spongiae]